MKKIVFAAVLLFAAPAVPAQDAKAPAEAVARPALDNIGDFVAYPRGCKTDADCKDPNPDDCKGYKCLPYKSEVNPVTGEVTTVGKCSEYGIPNCLPPPVQDCNELHKGDPYAIKCCGAGFSQASDPAAFKCCSEHVSHGEDPGTPENPKPCGDCPECRPCPTVPKINCDVIGDPKMKACCEEKGGLLWFVMDKCVEDGPGSEGDCNIIINAGGDFINNGQMNICCQVVNNSGTITDTTISQACENTGGGPGGGTTGGTPTTPEGGAAALTCSVAQVGNPADGEYEISYTLPSAGAPVTAALTQISGAVIRVKGEAEPSDFGIVLSAPKALGTKAITNIASPPPFLVVASTPHSMTGEWKAPFEVKVGLLDVGGTEVGSALCVESHFLHSQGAGCGCDLTGRLTGREQVLAYLVLAFLFAVPVAVVRWIKES